MYAYPGSKIHFHNVEKDSDDWAIDMDHMSLVQNPNYIFGRGQKIVVDSGTSFILMP
jgi:hypothetical protein